MSLPEFEAVRYAKSPLRLRVCQVRFPVLLRFGDPTYIADFQQLLGDRYPLIEREGQAGVQLSASGVVSAPHEQLYRFCDRERAWSVVLGEGSLTLEERGEHGVEELLGRFCEVATAAQVTLGVRERSRVGLRCLHELRAGQATRVVDWRELLRPELLGFAATLFDEPVEHTLQQVQVLRPDGQFVVRHGLMRGTALAPVAVAQGPGQDPFYLLDLDYADGRCLPLEVEPTAELLRAWHTFIHRFFRWSLSERLHRALEPQDVHTP